MTVCCGGGEAYIGDVGVVVASAATGADEVVGGRGDAVAVDASGASAGHVPIYVHSQRKMESATASMPDNCADAAAREWLTKSGAVGAETAATIRA
jgi:hypothetical protein